MNLYTTEEASIVCRAFQTTGNDHFDTAFRQATHYFLCSGMPPRESIVKDYGNNQIATTAKLCDFGIALIREHLPPAYFSQRLELDISFSSYSKSQNKGKSSSALRLFLLNLGAPSWIRNYEPTLSPSI